MMTISSDDPRSLRAVEIAAGAGDWEVCPAQHGVRAYRIPSQADPARAYLVTAASCTCDDFLRRNGLTADGEPRRVPDYGPCKHILAVRLHRALVEGAHTLRSH